MDQIRNGWFSEINELWPGQSFSLKVEQVLYKDKSDYQDIAVLKTKCHGNALILDGVIQCTEFDEFAYQEMISHIPLCAHRKPSKVLIVGGGDGGVAREVAKHPLVESIVQVEIDQKVIDASRRHLPFMARGFDSPKLDLKVCDGFEYIRNHREAFDVIITDSSDPIGPAVNLFTESYFEMLKKALRPGGIICSQVGTVWNDLDFIAKTLRQCKRHFGEVRYAVVSVPTYPSGQIGFAVAALDADEDVTEPKTIYTEDWLQKMDLRYYNSKIHSAAFVLPNFVKKALA